MTRMIKTLTLTIVTAISVSLAAVSYSDEGRNYYRYVNDEGVKVLDHSIPPEYAQKGYEILNSAGQVIKVVPPAPTDEDIAKAESERLLRERYYDLQRRYKTVDEIESAKRRRLASIDTNISILRGNISGLNTQLENYTTDAAGFEREGRQVPQALMQKIADARAELAVAKDLLKIRQDEYKNVQQQFNDDLTAFVKGSTLQSAQK